MNFDESATKNPADDYSPDDEATAVDPTRDTMAEGLMVRLLRPCVDRLDASIQCTRLSQLDLKLQLDSLATELKRLSLSQYMVTLPQSPSADNKTSVSPAPIKTDTCTLLDSYACRLSSARAKIAVVGNILESTQERLRALSHRIGREHNNRRSLLEPSTITGTPGKLSLEDSADKEKDKNLEEQLKQDEKILQNVENQEDGRCFNDTSLPSEST